MPGDRSEESDAALWLEVLSGTSSSFAVVYDRYRRQVFRKAYALTGDVADAEDVLAIVFLEAWRKRTDVRIVEGSLLPWLYVTAGLTAMNAQRAKRRHHIALAKLPAPHPAADIAIAVEETLDGVARIRAVVDALSRLRPKERIVVQLCLIDELPLAQAAAVLDLPVGTVKSRLHRARGKLQRLLSSSHADTAAATRFREVSDEPGQ